MICSLAFSADGKFLASGSQDNSVNLWNNDFGKYKEIAEIENKIDCLSPVAFSADGKYLASGSWDNTVKLWRMDTQK